MKHTDAQPHLGLFQPVWWRQPRTLPWKNSGKQVRIALSMGWSNNQTYSTFTKPTSYGRPTEGGAMQQEVCPHSFSIGHELITSQGAVRFQAIRADQWREKMEGSKLALCKLGSLLPGSEAMKLEKWFGDGPGCYGKMSVWDGVVCEFSFYTPLPYQITRTRTKEMQIGTKYCKLLEKAVSFFFFFFYTMLAKKC